MSRIFDGSNLNWLEASGALSANAAEVTFGAWIKDDFGSFERAWVATGGAGGGGSKRHHISTKDSPTRVRMFLEDVSPTSSEAAVTFSESTWILITLRAKNDGLGNTVWTSWFNGSQVDDLTSTVPGMLATDDNIILGQTASGSVPATGKIAHAFVFTRALSDSEIADLGGGTSPSSLASTGRYAYFPMEDNSLSNEWEADSGVGALTVNGTVANDDADNPTVSAPVVTPAVSLDQATLTPGGTISGTASNYDAAPTSPITVSDGSNTDNVTVTISGTGPYTFTGTMPATPTVAEGSVTVTVGEASTTATYDDGVTAGISALTVQQEGSPVAATDWEVIVNLLSDGTELYNQTAQVSDAAGLIGNVSLPARAVGETVEVLGYSAANSLWFRFYTDLVNLEA